MAWHAIPTSAALTHRSVCFQGNGARGGARGAAHAVVGVGGVHDSHETAEHDDEHGDRQRRLDGHTPALDSEECHGPRQPDRPDSNLVTVRVHRRRGRELGCATSGAGGVCQAPFPHCSP